MKTVTYDTIIHNLAKLSQDLELSQIDFGNTDYSIGVHDGLKKAIAEVEYIKLLEGIYGDKD